MGRAAGLIGPAPTKWEREYPRWPSHGTVARYFGSFGEGLIASGFDGRPPPPVPLAERLDVARRLAADGASTVEIADHLGVADRTVRDYLRAGDCRFCGVALATPRSDRCRECARSQTRPPWTREVIIEAAHRWTRTEGSVPSRDDWSVPPAGDPPNKWLREHGSWPSARAVKRHFGTWNAMLEAAGLPLHNRRDWNRERISEALRRWIDRHGRIPRMDEWRRNGPDRPSARTVLNHWGSWRAAVHSATESR